MSEIYIRNRQQFRVSMFISYLACFQHNEIAEILEKGKIRDNAWERLSDTSDVIDNWLLGYQSYKMDEIKKHHLNISNDLLKFVQFSFIGMFFLYPKEFYFKIKNKKEKRKFAIYWGNIMKEFGIKITIIF